jgi:putative endonuclease
MKPCKEGKLFYVYILLCADDSNYVGMTNDIRVYRGTQVVNNAIRREKNLKTWSHAKKTALINGEFETLRQLSKKKFKKKN